MAKAPRSWRPGVAVRSPVTLTGRGTTATQDPRPKPWEVWLARLGDHAYACTAAVVALVVAIAAHAGWVFGVMLVPFILLWWRWAWLRSWTTSRALRRRTQRAWAQVAWHVLPADRDGLLPSCSWVEPWEHGLLLRLDLPHGVTPDTIAKFTNALAHGLTNELRGISIVSARVEPAELPGQCLLRLFTGDPLDQATASQSAGSFGVLESGAPLVFDPRLCPHLLVCGETGSGKSSWLRGLMVQLATAPPTPGQEWHFVLLDPKVVEFGNWPEAGRVALVASDLSDIAEALEQVVAEMNTRFERMAEAGVQSYRDLRPRPQPGFILFDEVASALGDNRKSVKPLVDSCLSSLSQLVLKGRAAGLTVCLAMQRPDAALLGSGLLRDNLVGRVALRGMGREGVGMCFPNADSAEIMTAFINEPGTGVAWRLGPGTEQPTRFRSYEVSVAEARAALGCE